MQNRGLISLCAWAASSCAALAGFTDPPGNPGVAALVAKVAPAVVSITTTVRAKPQQQQQQHSDKIFGGGDEAAAGQISGWASGSGVIISADGYIVTNNHVVADADGIIVTRPDQQKDYEAKLIGTDPETDLAVIKIEASDLPFLRFAEPDSYRIGDAVIAVGNPFGLGQAVSMGIISAINRTLTPREFEDYIQTDASINHGNSGGALVTLEGALVGINSSFYNYKGRDMPSGVNFAIAAPLASKVVALLEKNGKIRRSYLGVELENLNPGLAAMFGIPQNINGVVVTYVKPGSPADQSGLKQKDVITAFNGHPVRTQIALEESVTFSEPGSKVELTINRDNRGLTKTVELAERPEQSSGGDGSIGGLTLAALTDALRQKFRIPSDVTGVCVVDVEADSPFGKAGFEPGMVISRVNGTPVESPEDLADLARNADKIVLKVWTGQRYQSVRFRLT